MSRVKIILIPDWFIRKWSQIMVATVTMLQYAFLNINTWGDTVHNFPLASKLLPYFIAVLSQERYQDWLWKSANKMLVLVRLLLRFSYNIICTYFSTTTLKFQLFVLVFQRYFKVISLYLSHFNCKLVVKMYFSSFKSLRY